MGLGYDMVEALVRENKYKPLTGEVVLIGRQTIYYQPHEIIALLRDNEYDISSIDPKSIELDTNTIDRRQPYDKVDLISDTGLFKLLGVPKIRALDHSAYEGADIIHDLTQPLPDKLKNFADFIVDGSTLDNTFNPAATIKNYAEFLKPGGRLLAINQYSNHHNPYVLMHPLWYLDYFTMNKFSDCKVYIVVYRPEDHTNIFCINLEYLMDKNRQVSTFTSNHEMAVIVLAEKGPNSTADMFPSQQHYRSDAEWETYRNNLAVIQKSKRPHVVRTHKDITFFDVKGGHLLIGSDFSERDPSTEMRRTAPVDYAKRKSHNLAKRGAIKLLKAIAS